MKNLIKRNFLKFIVSLYSLLVGEGEAMDPLDEQEWEYLNKTEIGKKYIKKNKKRFEKIVRNIAKKESNKEKERRKSPKYFYYGDDDICDYLSAYLIQNEEFTQAKNFIYLLSDQEYVVQPILDQSDKKKYFVAVSSAIGTVEVKKGNLNLDFFLDKSTRQDDENTKLLKKLIKFIKKKKPKYNKLLDKIHQFKKDNNSKLEVITSFLNDNDKNVESVRQAFQLKLVELQQNESDVFEELMPYLMSGEENTYAKILFPYNLDNIHWLTGEIRINKEINKNAKKSYRVEVYTHDPYGGGKMDKVAFKKIKKAIRKRIKESDKSSKKVSIKNLSSPYEVGGQNSSDAISCGAVAIENLIKRISGKTIGDVVHKKGAPNLRKQQLEIVKNSQPNSSFIQRNEKKVKALYGKRGLAK